MAKTCKYYKQIKQVSYDSGQTWSNVSPAEYRTGELYQSDSVDCGSVVIYRWVNLDPSTDYYCSGTTKYYKQQKQVSYDNGSTWNDVSPAEYRTGELYEQYSVDCGSVPQYRWVYLDPYEDWYCSGTTKYFKKQKQVSYDDGNTWNNVTPAEYEWGHAFEIDSEDCGGTPSASGEYLTFIVQENNVSFKFYKGYSGATIEYSIDSGNTWSELPNTYWSTPYLSSGDTIMWRGNTNRNINSVRLGHFSSYKLTGVNTAEKGGKFDVSGNVLSIVYSDDFSTYISHELNGNERGLYNGLFSGCQVVDASRLFLPFKFQYDNSPGMQSPCAFYVGTFKNCTYLTTPPKLLAATATSNCYQEMFEGCTSLVTAPLLPAIKLSSYCYDRMFSGCTSLINAPELPATELTETQNCYDRMFAGCTSLVTAPSLPALENAGYSYRAMFAGCSSLNYVKCMLLYPSSYSTQTRAWLSGVSPTGTFVKHTNSNWDRGESGIPNGWEIQTATS